jgi:hypothetical protein
VVQILLLETQTGGIRIKIYLRIEVIANERAGQFGGKRDLM